MEGSIIQGQVGKRVRDVGEGVAIRSSITLRQLDVTWQRKPDLKVITYWVNQAASLST